MNTSLPTVKDVQAPGKPNKTQEIRKRSQSFAGENFFSGVLVLTVSNLLVKALGMLFKIPMNYIVGDTGMGYYNAAYTIYTFFYMQQLEGTLFLS